MMDKFYSQGELDRQRRFGFDEGYSAGLRMLKNKVVMGRKEELADFTEVDALQEDITEWINFNFATTRDELTAVVGLVEEVGELSRAVVKRRQGIRGTKEEWDAEIRKELGDIFIKLVDVADFYKLSLSQVIWNRWATIQERNWVANPNGQGLPK